MFSSLSFNQLGRRFRNERAEPDFGPRNAASLTNHGRKPVAAPEVSTASHRTDAAGPPVGILLYLASVGLIAAVITGVFFGTGFWLLASPAGETITASGRDPSRPNGAALKTSGAAVLEVAEETETAHSAAINLIPGSPLAQRSAAAEAAPPQQNNITQELSAASPNGEPPVETASVPQSVSSTAVPPAYLMPLASPPAVTAAESAPSAGTRVPSARDRDAHARTASRHPHPRSDRSAPTLTPP
jgi:hypothetical protein